MSPRSRPRDLRLTFSTERECLAEVPHTLRGIIPQPTKRQLAVAKAALRAGWRNASYDDGSDLGGDDTLETVWGIFYHAGRENRLRAGRI